MPGLPQENQTRIKEEAVDQEDEFFFDDAIASDDDSYAYEPRPRLSEPTVYMRPLGYLIKGLETGKINVDPEYQREVVWTAERMTGLINSLMENFYIPPIILNRKTTGNSGEFTLVCVDGKQRLSSVRAFTQGLIPCRDRKGIKWWFCIPPDSSSKTKRVLPEEVKAQFLKKEFCSFEYRDVSAEQEEDLFARVQMGMQLSAAEKLRAQTGPWQELGRLFVEDYSVVFSLLKDRSRAKDFQMALSCFSQIGECEHPMAANGIPVLRTTHTALAKLVNNKAAADDRTKAHLASVFNTFQELINEDPEIFTNTGRRLKSVQTFAPIEMVAVTVIISMYSETRNNALLLGDIKALRDHLREKFIDLRMNTLVWKTVWEFIDRLEDHRGVVPGTEIDRTVRPQRTRAPRQEEQQDPEGDTLFVPKKKGKAAAKPKPPTAGPGNTTIASDTHKRKRQRVDNGTSATENTASSPFAPLRGSSVHSATDSTNAPNENVQDDAMALDESSTEIRQPHTTIKQEPRDVPMPSATKPNPSKTPIRLPAPPFSGNPASASTPKPAILNPAEARRNRIAELNSYRAPTASMGSPATLRAPAVASASTPTQASASASASKRPTRSSPLLDESQVEHTPLASKAPPAASKPQPVTVSENIIDLTSDGEQERRSLLTSFTKPGQTNKPVTRTSLNPVQMKKEYGEVPMEWELDEEIVTPNHTLPMRAMRGGKRGRYGRGRER